MSVVQSMNKYVYDGLIWDVLPKELDQDKKIMDRLFALKDKCFEHSSRLFALRMDFRLNHYTADNSPITHFHQQLIPALRKKYPKSLISYAWVREQVKSEAQHYHYVLIMNAHHVRYAQPLVDLMSQSWAKATGGTYWLPQNPWYLLGRNDADSQAGFMKRVSYLGKKRSKENTPAGVKCYETALRLPKRITGKIKPEKIAGSWAAGPELQTEESFSSIDKEPLKQSISLPKQIENYGLIPALPGKELSTNNLHLPRSLFWIWHRNAFCQQQKTLGISVEKYISDNRLQQKSATRHLKQRAFSPFWNEHIERYHCFYWPLGASVKLYCELHGLKFSSARRYLVNFNAHKIKHKK